MNRYFFDGICFAILFTTSIFCGMTNKKNGNRGFAAMDPDRRRAVAKKGGHAGRKKAEGKKEELTQTSSTRGFAAMDIKKRKEIAKRGGSTSRRNRIDWKEQVVIL